jgi:pyruvate/2-oxoglutarate/acetoin dehydrogenase E1 component
MLAYTGRTASGTDPNGFVAQHSQDYSAWYGSLPGLKVVSPWSAKDAKGFLNAAIYEPDPILLLELQSCGTSE